MRDFIKYRFAIIYRHGIEIDRNDIGRCTLAGSGTIKILTLKRMVEVKDFLYQTCSIERECTLLVICLS